MRDYRSIRRLTQPLVEPVSLADAKRHCRVDTDADNDYIASLITAAREWVESYIDETLIHTQYAMKMDFFPPEVVLPRPPMATDGTTTAVSITYTLTDKSTTVMSTTRYRVDRDAYPGVIRTPYGMAWPSYLYDFNSITVTWWGGRGPDATAVPQRVKNAILMLVGYWYERRLAADANASEIPFGVKSLLDSMKWGSYQ